MRANILAQVSFALNRIYTNFTPAVGTISTSLHLQRMTRNLSMGRNIFDSVSELVDDLFNNYLRRQGYVEPLAAGFCNGTTSTCNGLSQWGSENLAQQGQSSVEIVHHYYGSDVEIVVDAPEQDIRYSYPGTPLREGDISPEVQIAQVMLNRIAVAYPAIPQIQPINGVFSSNMANSVQIFQRIFNLTVDGVIGKATWYTMVSRYTGVLPFIWSWPARVGPFIAWAILSKYHFLWATGKRAYPSLQYLLAILGSFISPFPV
ncbi:MAG: peptidoglycan-binding protein [Evtepia sp.]